MKEKFGWLDNLRVLATFAVIILHVAAPISRQYGIVSTETWQIGNFYNGITRFCVPLFFMLSGALLLSKDYELGYFLKKRFWRIIPPLFFWSLIYIGYDRYVIDVKSDTWIETLRMILLKVFHGSQYHLWFVYTILGLYLFIPILRKWIKQSNNTEILYFLAIWLLTIVFDLPYINVYVPAITLTNFAGYVGFLVLGYYLSDLNVKNKYIPIAFILIGGIITIYGTYFVTAKNHEFSKFFYAYLMPNVILSATGVFLLLKEVRIKNERIRTAISFLSNQSFGIYLAHVLVLSLLDRIGINWMFENPIISIPVTSAICFLLSSLTISLIQKVKFGNLISG